ncbi:MAG TPA: xanthine dehydrogenase family protein subunit M [Candidatus Binatia bacterium]|jgi:carbon-monoxide dehydrogenase medium subunit
MLRRFRLEEPETVQEASQLLARHGEAARIYAGGTELLLVMKEGLAHYERLVNVKKIPHLDEVKLTDGFVSIGALSTHRQLLFSPVVRRHLPAFAGMEANVANIRVREVGTIGGNLCFAEPHADPGTLLLALGAKVIAAKNTGQREILIEKFFVDAYETCLEPDELLTEIRVPRLPARSGVAYLKFGYLERPSVGVALFLSLDGNGKSVGDARIAVGCVGPTARRIQEAESLLEGKSVDEASRLIAEAGAAAARASQAISDLHGSQDYKEHIVGVLLKRAFRQAVEQCRQRVEG